MKAALNQKPALRKLDRFSDNYIKNMDKLLNTIFIYTDPCSSVPSSIRIFGNRLRLSFFEVHMRYNDGRRT